MSIIPFSPHRDSFINDLNKKDKKLNLTNEELSEIDLGKLKLENELLKQIDNSNEILRAILWNSKGETKAGYAAFRKLLSQIITKDLYFDLFITQEPLSVVDKNYIDNYFNNDYEIVYPVKKKARKEVAIIYRKKKIQVLKNENPYSLIEESRINDNIEYSNFFLINGKGRIQITHFKTITESPNNICVFNIHSVYKFSDKVKDEFILSFFRFVKWYINKILSPKEERFNLLVAGDFNYDIFSKDFPDLVFNKLGLKIVIPSPPTIDSSYDEKEIAPTNIDYFITVHDVRNGLTVSNVSKLPIRFDNYQDEFKGAADLREDKDLLSSKVSTHDPQYCCLKIKSE
ncbi:hypothetical protein ACTFIR_000114 [Dictyostelium discoideum]